MYEENYYGGVRQGVKRTYDQEGNISEETFYEKDTLIYIKDYVKGRLHTEGFIKNGVLEGPFIRYYPNGKIEVELQMKNGLSWNVISFHDTLGNNKNYGKFENGTGDCDTYSQDGHLLSKIHFDDGIVNGVVYDYYPNGQVEWEMNHSNGMMQGQTKYYNENGELIELQNYSNGERDGLSFRYFKGRVIEKDVYYKGRIWNILELNDTTGKPIDHSTFKDGNGIHPLYDDNGVYYGFETLKYGLRHGACKIYNDDQKLMFEENYFNDTLNGVYKAYFSSGKVRNLTTYVMGSENGISEMYHDNGQLWRRDENVDGFLWNVECNYDRNGKKMDKGTISNGNGTMLRYNENGEVVFIYQVKNGMIINLDKEPPDEERFR